MNNELISLLPNSGFFSNLFGMMEICEEEIARMKKIHPLQSDIIDNCFIMFAEEEDRDPFWDMPLLFRYHVREILERAVNLPSRKEERCLGTDAQAIVAFYQLTLRTPVTQDAALAYFKLVQRTIMTDDDEIREKLTERFEKYIANSFDGTYESYLGAVDEAIYKAKRVTSFMNRKFPQEVNNDALVGELFDSGAKSDDRVEKEPAHKDLQQLGFFDS